MQVELWLSRGLNSSNSKMVEHDTQHVLRVAWITDSPASKSTAPGKCHGCKSFLRDLAKEFLKSFKGEFLGKSNFIVWPEKKFYAWR
jgi:hypothetical protein